jgi:hypothetical protein
MSGQNSDTDTSFLSESDSDVNISRSDSGNEADDEAEKPITYKDAEDKLPNIVESGGFYRFELTEDEKDQLEKIQEEQEKEVEEEYQVFTQEQVIHEPDVLDDAIAEEIASQVVDDLDFEIEENPQAKTAVIRTSTRPRKDSAVVRESKEVKALEEAAKAAKTKKETPNEYIFQSQNSQVNSQIANTYLKVEVGSQSTVAKKLITNDIRLESITPDSQAKKIFTDAELTAMKSCYLCGFDFKDRVSAKHNERWGYPKYQETKSYDHTAPVNFSVVVVRVPSTDSSYEPSEIEHLKTNGKMACFHCNYTKSQRMFITCPKNKDDGTIDFQKFKPNDEVIQKFVNNLYNNLSEWSKGPDGVQNTLHECVKKYKGGKTKWIGDRIRSITESAEKVCEMIKKNVSQSNVIKRFYFMNLLIAKARELLKTDPYFNDQSVKLSRRKAYENRFIVKFVAKAEATDPKFVKPWNGSQALKGKLLNQSSKRGLPIIQETDKEKYSQGESSEEVISPIKRTKSIGSSRKRKNKRKTYRRIRLF